MKMKKATDKKPAGKTAAPKAKAAPMADTKAGMKTKKMKK